MSKPFAGTCNASSGCSLNANDFTIQLARAEELTVHCGRHSYISHALAGGRSLAEVAAAAGHANITITAICTHVAVDDDGRIGSLFSFNNSNGNGDPK